MKQLRDALTRFGTAKIVLGIVVVAALAASGWVAYQQHQSPHATSLANETPNAAPTFPVPSAARSTYTNPAFGYTVRYPTQWTLDVSAAPAVVRVLIVQDNAVPEGTGFEIWCASNPSGMNAQQWRQSEVPPNFGEVAVGYITLSSGTLAYKVVGHATGTYDVFTSVHGGSACDLTEYETDATNTKIIEASINSFTWN